jgi:MYXO-CTERM domain-containing protein
MDRSFASFVFGAFLLFASLPSSHAQILVNDYSGAVTGYGFTESFSDYYAESSPTTNPTASGNLGQVDLGFYTVNYRNMPNFQTAGYSIVNAYTGDMGSWSGSGGFYTGGSYFNLEGITGFLVSLRKEAFNTASTINFYILTNQDMEVYIPISTSGISSTSFTDVAIDLNGFSGYTFVPGLQASQIGIKGSLVDGEIFNFSIDSLRAIPEPSAGVFLTVGLGALALRRRRRS